MSQASSAPRMPAERVLRPSTVTKMKVWRSAVSPIAVRGCRSAMSERSGKHEVAAGSAQVRTCPSTTSSGNPLTSAKVPAGGVGSALPFIQPSRRSPAMLLRTHPVCLNSTKSGPKAIQP